MWVNKQLFDMIVADNKAQDDKLLRVWNTCQVLQTKWDDAAAQKTKDDLTIDWLRHRVNALEKQNSILMGKATGLNFPTPEIVPTRPGNIGGGTPDFDTMPSFEDLGDSEADRFGIKHDFEGNLAYTK